PGGTRTEGCLARPDAVGCSIGATASSAACNISVRYGSANCQSTATRPADMLVMSTQPGTSPRSLLRRFGTPTTSLLSWHDRADLNKARVQREQDGHRQHEEHDRHQHRDLLAAADLHQVPPARLAHVRGL